MQGSRIKVGLVVVVSLSALVLLAPGVHGVWVNLFGLLIVLGGTLLAVLLSRPQALVMEVVRSLPDLYQQRADVDFSEDVQGLLRVSNLHRLGKARQLEHQLPTLRHPLLRKGVQLMLDRCNRDDLQRVLQLEVVRHLEPARERIAVLRSMASFAPAFGMLGTLLGLIHMLHGLGDEGLSQMGAAMGFALMTTLFGLVAANMVFKPLAMKLERQHDRQADGLAMLCEGLLLMHDHKHPLLIQDRLEVYRSHQVRAQAPVASNTAPLVSAYAK